MHYRFATAADVSLLAAMNRQLIQDEGHRNRMSPAELEQRMNGWLKEEYEAVLFENDGRAVGYALYKRETDRVYLRQFFVEADQRRKGIGSAAVAWLLSNAWRQSLRIQLDVLVGNSAGIAFWRSLGFADYCTRMELVR
ncbi:MAG: GNAT family N-acetyltransferase [Pirellulales bacterium]